MDNNDKNLTAIIEAIASSDGRPYYVGGYVRDSILGIPSKDIDIEVHGISPENLVNVLSTFGEVDLVGASFGVYKIKGMQDFDFSIPRRDNKAGNGHKGFKIKTDPFMGVIEAAKRRDFTINAIMKDAISGEIVDPFGGAKDLHNRILRVVDETTFKEDPLRALRGVQFAARFGLSVPFETMEIMAAMDLSSLSKERFFQEFRKLLLSDKPSIGLKLLRDTGLIHHFPEIAALIDVPQDKVHHPEGCCFTHSLMVVDEAAKNKTGDKDRDFLIAMAGLCHDFGKPGTTTFSNEKNKWISYGHEEAGEEPTRAFLNSIKAPNDFTEKVVVLVQEHLKPILFVKNKSGRKAYLKLAERLFKVGLSFQDLHDLSFCDVMGRTTEKALNRNFDEGKEFMAMVASLNAGTKAGVKPVVTGKHLIARGINPSHEFSNILAKCKDIQFEKGIDNPDTILDEVLSGF